MPTYQQDSLTGFLLAHHIGTTVVDCRNILDKIPQDSSKRMVSLTHKLAPIDQVVHNPRFVSIGFLEHSYPHKDVVGRLRDEDEGGESRFVATDSTQSAFLDGDPGFVE